MLGNLATSMIAGIVIFVTLRATGVPYAGVLAIWVGIVDFLPLVGGLLAGGDRDACRVPGLSTAREPRPESSGDEPDGAVEPPLGAAGDPHRCRAGRDRRVHARRSCRG